MSHHETGVIDFETHYYPEEYLRLLKGRTGAPRFLADAQGRLVLQYSDTLSIPRWSLLPKFTNPEKRIKDMEASGVRRQVLSIPLPGCDRLPPEEAAKVCRAANEGLGALCSKRKDHFSGLALLPVQDEGLMREEFARAVKEEGLVGVHVHSNTNGLMLDSPHYQAVFDVASREDVPVFVHPTIPVNVPNLGGFRLESTFGLQIDLSLSVLRMVFAGTLERLPNLKVIVAHLGSSLAYLSNRIDDEYDTVRTNDMKITKRPSEYVKKLLVDTVAKHPDPIRFATSYFGADRVLFGSDYPFWDTRDHVRAVRGALSEEESEKVLGLNAAALFDLDS